MEDIHVQEISCNDSRSAKELLTFVQSQEQGALQVVRKKSFESGYFFLSPHFHIIGLYQNKELKAIASFIQIPGTPSYLMTNLLKAKDAAAHLVTPRIVQFFLDLKMTIKPSLVFVEENLNHLDSLVSRGGQKYGWEIKERLIYSNIFFVEDEIETDKEPVRKEQEIKGHHCTFYSDRMFRTFFLHGKMYTRAYVELSEQVREKEALLSIVKEGKSYAKSAGCNTFVLLTGNKLELQQDYVYVNRFFEMGNTSGLEFFKVLCKGILL